MQDNSKTEYVNCDRSSDDMADPQASTADQLQDARSPDAAESARRLQQVYENLQKASLDVGFLESQLKDYRSQVEALSEAEERINRLSELERENQEMGKIARQAKLAEALSKENEAMREAIQSSKSSSVSWWQAVEGLLPGSDNGPSAQRARPLGMEDYYLMIQQHLKR